MKIAVFGCSWSFGVPVSWSKQISTPEQQHKIPKEDFVCWPRELGKIKSDWLIHNYSMPGASIMFSCSMLEMVLEKDEYDLLIFQATTPYRFTYWKDTLKENIKLKEYEPNVFMGSQEGLSHVTIVNHHNSLNEVYNKNMTWRENKIETDFVKKYYKRVSNSMFESEYKILCDWAKSKSNIFFTHRKNELIDCASVDQVLGKSKFNRLICDQGSHFGLEGAQWQAKWMLDKINTL